MIRAEPDLGVEEWEPGSMAADPDGRGETLENAFQHFPASAIQSCNLFIQPCIIPIFQSYIPFLRIE
jgi:hypothetical protein